jgi:hypothetical protein
MQKISRIYLAGCGYRTAWHDGNVIPLTDPVSGQPTDTILQLENGGGKTTLLALVFSCFETEQNRFLKHLQSKNHRFSEYFDQNAAPGYIIVEWLMPPRTAGGSPYRLIVGQAVCVRNTTVPADVERLFFSFREQDDLRLEDLPLPNLASPAVSGMQEFSRWVYEQQRKNPDFFPTRNQEEWKKHLKSDRLIDLEMLQMQVSFSAQEGGFDAFVNFKSESEFLRKFFALTLDQLKADEARKLVVEVCEKHARKPEFQRRHNELTKFRGTLSAFTTAARAYLAALADEGQVVVEGAVLSLALQARAAQFQSEFETESQMEEAQRSIARTASSQADSLARQSATATHVWHQKKVERAKTRKGEADGQIEQREKKERNVRAARLQRDIQSSQRQIDDLQALAEAASADLVMPREHAEIQGALFRRAIFQEEARVRGVLEDLAKRAKARESAKTKQTGLQEQASRDEFTLAKEEAQLKGAEERRAARLATLAGDGLLAFDGEGADDAIARWESTASSHEAQRSGLLAQRKTAMATAVERRSDANKERLRAGQFRTSARQLQDFLAAGEAERERLSQLPSLLEAVESDTADPFSPLLGQLLTNVLASCSKQIAAIDVRLAELGLTKQAIETSKVAGYSADVAQVVQVLRDAGIRSARPFNEYIAEAIPQVDRARALVLSDPARFLGVAVARAEFEKASHISFEGRHPRKPVMVSITALEPIQMPGERTVVRADSDAAFNVPAAAELAKEIAGKVRADTEQRQALETRQFRTAKAIQDVETFVHAYGDGKLAKAAAEEKAAIEDAEASSARAESLDTQAEELDVQADVLESQAAAAAEQHRQALDAVRRLGEFRAEYEDGRPHRLHRLGELPALVLDAQERQASAKELLEQLQSEHDSDVAKNAQEGLYFEQLGQERAALKYYDKDYDAQKALAQNPRPLDELRRSYRAAEEHYLLEESARLGGLAIRIKAETERKTEKSAEFNRDFHDVAVEDFKPFIAVNHEEVLAHNAIELAGARKIQSEASATHQLATKEAKSFVDKNKALIDAADPELQSREVEDLEVLRAQIETELEDAQNRMRDATEEANKARSRAEGKKASMETDLTADRMLRGALSLPDKPDLALAVAKLAAETGVHSDTSSLAAPVLSLKPADQVSALLQSVNDKRRATKKLSDAARRAFEGLRDAAASKGFVEADADVAHQMQQNSFEDTCRDAERLLTHLDDRLQTTEATLKNMQADFDACIEEVSEVVRGATLTLTRACSPDKCVPAAAPYIGGKQVLKMRGDFSRINTETRRLVMRGYLDWLAETKQVPARGTDLIAEAVAKVHAKPLGLQVLKMSIEETEQYVLVEKISNSGGEGVVMAMFLYLVISQLRAQNYADVQKSGGGPLILDNPFAKATSAAMWRAQRLLAKEMNVQLIFATAIQDYNALGEFQRFVRMRKLQNQKTRRWHLECANFTMTEAAAEALA